jgi:UDP-3-O-[3-hydroxymyristoyl] N-acetylglucosamine deacetylase
MSIMAIALTAGFEKSGIGLHSGERTRVRVSPAAAGSGRYFVRVDLPGSPVIPARIESVCQTQLSTELAVGEAKVRTVEHLLAAIAGLGIEDARIEIDGAEVPLLDGSAREWTEALLPAIASIAGEGEDTKAHRIWDVENSPAGLTESVRGLPPTQSAILTPLWLTDRDAFVAALPSPELRFSYGIDFQYAAIGNQWHSWSPAQVSFASEIAPARTFGFAPQVEQLRQAGLIKGGTLENALVCDESGWLNPPLRFANEPVRHKILDLVGDLSLLGHFPTAHYLAYKASHTLHTQFVRLLQQHLAAKL